MKSKIGLYSLIAAISGFVVFEVLIHVGLLEGVGWRVLATGFEAATVGALADWFAVSALFYEIPIPYVRRHTNIIVKNRDKLTEGIVEMVTTKWLSPQIIQEKLQGVEITKYILKLLDDPENLDKTLMAFRKVILKFSEGLDDPKMARFIQNMLHDQLKDFEVAEPLGKWLEETVSTRKHQQVVSMVIGEVEKYLRTPETRQVVFEKLKLVLEEYRKLDWIKMSAIWVGKRTGGIDLDILTEQLIEVALVMAREIEGDSTHPVRRKMDTYFLEFANNLRIGDKKSVRYIQDLKDQMVLNVGASHIIQSILTKLQSTLASQLEHDETELMIMIKDGVKKYINQIRNDVDLQLNIDNWLKNKITYMINEFHPHVGTLVRDSLGRLDDKEIMTQIKDKVGDDLQYIRLNGAVVGFLVGVTIALVRLFSGI
ncbi:DUF445 domain-containing protein [Litoribacter alkaliphilus]|uniref:DUF445 domain-containing protein n=1 Tax=Litoribacter ruber TaxID=702568 RepID=A0AAP2CK92_9BACT|nr:DUF445 domain-containing protein [Litoribacter alkaliphilus]MBS9525294.1 DUF445 domain-containing protein [Litoribacter alkaliphilus]